MSYAFFAMVTTTQPGDPSAILLLTSAEKSFAIRVLDRSSRQKSFLLITELDFRGSFVDWPRPGCDSQLNSKMENVLLNS